jgi:hypothetical protein
VFLPLDIETLPSPYAPDPFTVKVRKDLKDPDKIAAAITKGVADEWASQALDPMMGSTLTIGFSPPDTFAQDIRDVVAWWPPPERVAEDNRLLTARYAERTLLEWLETLIFEKKVSSLVTWGGAEFDIPWLIKRAMVYKMHRLAAQLKGLPHHDLMKVWSLGARHKRDEECHALTHVARGLGGQRPDDDIGGGGVFGAFRMNDLHAIDRHVKWDIVDLCLIGSRLQSCGLWDPAETPRRW